MPVRRRMSSKDTTSAATATSGPSVTRLGLSRSSSTRKRPDGVEDGGVVLVAPVVETHHHPDSAIAPLHRALLSPRRPRRIRGRHSTSTRRAALHASAAPVRRWTDHPDRRIRCSEPSCLLALALLALARLGRSQEMPMLESRLEVLTVATGEREVVYSAQAHFEAPNWSRDGKAPPLQPGGPDPRRCRSTTRKPAPLDTGIATRCNNDHGLSPDGTWLAISDQSQGDGQSLIYVLPAAGRDAAAGDAARARPTGTAGRPTGRRSPTARSAAASTTSTRSRSRAARRRGSPRRPGLDDGPDYSPDGRDLVQLGAHRGDEDLAHGPGRRGARSR